MLRAARRDARAVSFSSRTPSTISSSVPSITAAGEAAACSNKVSAVRSAVNHGRMSRMCALEPIARSSVQSEDSHTRAIARTAAIMPSEPKPVRIALRSFPPTSLGVKVGLPLKVGTQAAGLRESLGDGRINEEDVVAKAADCQHVFDGAQQLV
eukprot:5916598-Pleurochrysis_carterae.AAC.1